MKKLVMIITALAGMAATADEITLDGATVITSSTTISDKVTGSGYYVVANGSTLTLANAENDFTGGVIVSNGVLEATASGAFGTGPISLESTAATRTVKLNAAKGVFNNAITIRDAGTSSAQPAIYVVATATLNGDVTLDQGMTGIGSAYVNIKVGTDTSSTATKLTLEGKMLAGSGRVEVRGWGQLAFKQKVTCCNMYLGGAYSECGTVELWSSENEIASIGQTHFNIKCCADNAINKTSYQMNFNTSWGNAGYCITYLQGHSVHYRYFNVGDKCDVDFSAKEQWGEMIYNVNGYKPVTVLFDAEGLERCSGRCCTRFYGAINLKMENRFSTASGTYYQAFQGRDNSGMVGNISIGNRCQFRIFNGCRFGGVTNLTVESGGFITYEKRDGKTTPIGNTFTGLKDLYLKGTAFIRTETEEAVNPVNSPDCILHMDETARLYLQANITNTVKKLYVNGKLKPAGYYTAANLPQMKHATNPGNYPGVLHVLKGQPGFIVVIR